MGMKKCIIQKHILLEQYEEAIFEGKTFCHSMNIYGKTSKRCTSLPYIQSCECMEMEWLYWPRQQGHSWKPLTFWIDQGVSILGSATSEFFVHKGP